MFHNNCTLYEHRVALPLVINCDDIEIIAPTHQRFGHLQYAVDLCCFVFFQLKDDLSRTTDALEEERRRRAQRAGTVHDTQITKLGCMRLRVIFLCVLQLRSPMSNLISLAKLLKLYITLFQKHMCKHGLRKKKIRGSYTPALSLK